MSKKYSELSFKLKYVDNHGTAQGLFAQKGFANEEAIILGKERLIYEDIANSTTRDNRLILAISPTASLSKKVSNQLINEAALVLEIHQINALDLKRFIDRINSKKQAEITKQQFIEAAEGHLFYTVNCPECGATINLSRLNKTSYTYCRFCETIFQQNQDLMTKGSKYRTCDECQMFDRVQGYTEFYFYFLLIIYGYSFKRRYLCDNCADKVFWKTLLINFLFIVGIIPSIWIKIKSLMNRDSELEELAKANALARIGNYQQADVIYSQLYNHYPNHPGLLMNEGLGHLFGNDGLGGAERFKRSLGYCSNYYPVINLIQKIQSTSQQQTNNTNNNN
ncbi:MAG: hypothetical protein F6K40_22135 [Okeania sp. SIO3I5]|uniref:hypothetical protein n=1 Tax=Okeania sp. SIO3I5 TaxID=2607805 RepID=UPI0013BDA0F5|nr:hypothetical protein [Okeania sp. SIO3I5]NEQ38822.1 hypothetical protein [Okeania sp. SIO3I5]